VRFGLHTNKAAFLRLTNVFTSIECVKWVSKSLRSFHIVEDEEFLCLMKIGRPSYQIPKAKTVAKDVLNVFRRIKDRIAKMLQVSLVDSFLKKI